MQSNPSHLLLVSQNPPSLNHHFDPETEGSTILNKSRIFSSSAQCQISEKEAGIYTSVFS
jgi:hypothetical protein